MAAVTVYSAPDDGRKVRPKHVEFKHQIKGIKKLHLIGIYMTRIIKMHGTMNMKI